MKVQNINISALELNNGQIEGLPKNPRFIRDNQFEKLKKSIQDFPEMLQYRELIVYPFDGKFVVVAGNMRYRAGKEIGLDEFPCKILDANTTVERLKEITIKDNNSFGEWNFDDLANEWDTNELKEWGCDIPSYESNENFDDLFDDNSISPDNESLSRNWIEIKIKINPENKDNEEEIRDKILTLLESYKGLIIK